MDFTESTKAVYSRIQQIDPENVSKIIGYLLLQDQGEREMVRLAFGPDNSIYSLVHRAKSDLGLMMNNNNNKQQQQPAEVAVVPLHHHYAPNYSEFVPNYSDQMQQFFTMDDPNPVNFFYPESGRRTSRRSPSLPEFPVKMCHYYSKGFCKHGSSCRYFHHGVSTSDIFKQSSSADIMEEHNNHVVSPGSLERLELELTELLKSRRGVPVSIASLPMMYYDKYGRTLQAEGYLTESQRHGKAGFSLTKLLARLRHSIRLIDRPHGQHSVMLAEDVPKYLECAAGERNDPGGIVAGSKQIYLTFPAESTFTEHDVSNYFSKFGAVQDVRIPSQQKRMFGFVTFVFEQTVKQILAKGNPHFVCGARVLVKPYREKSRLFDRKYYSEKMHQSMCYHNSHYIDGDSELGYPSFSSRLMRRQLIEEQEQALEFERRRLSEMQLTSTKTALNHRSFFGYSMVDELKLPEGTSEAGDFPSAERLNYLLDVLSEDKVRNASGNYHEQDSNNVNGNGGGGGHGLNLPESPFAAPIGSGISTVM
ncbi:unnamed protein product [Linum tenue]|uniref:Zinc finger CCCH domain-containing protein 18-like n=1 Tax=Linum tenue TaxID=586396 RepID=A0AAV0GZ91_9ROSI|nr:unnamed protein product [Linum tenue]